jgi:uncharacterized protein DUF2865
MVIHTLVNFARPYQPWPGRLRPVEPTMILRLLGAIGPLAAVLAVTAVAARAQSMPPPPGGAPQQQNPICGRLEAQLAALDRGGDPRAEQIRRYEEALRAQQGELDRTVAQAKSTGCEGSGFFLFGRSQPPQCDDLNNRMQRMRSNLDRLNADLQALRNSGGGAADGQRRQILSALGQNDCGPQYRAAATPARPRGFFETLFGGGGSNNNNTAGAPFGSGDITPSDQTSTFRTICVRTCDGFFFPVSYSASQGKFRDDEQVCQRMCPASEVVLFTYRNPGEDVNQAVSINGQPYTSLPNAFKYRQEFNPACSCKRPGESWAEALKHLDDTTVERGDIIVTDETSKQLAQPKPDPATKGTKQTRAGKAEGRPQGPGDAGAAAAPTGATPTGTAPPTGSATPVPVTAAPLPDAAPPAPAAPAAPPSADQGKKSIRTVGPPFIVR